MKKYIETLSEKQVCDIHVCYFVCLCLLWIIRFFDVNFLPCGGVVKSADISFKYRT